MTETVASRARAWHALDPAYPRALHDLGPRKPDPLHVLGDAPWPDTPMATVVGARAETPYARRAVARTVAALVQAGVGVVSGLARGVDATAHRAALARGGFTAAVLGVGIDRVYPPEHASLYTAIARRGLVVSPFPAGTGVRPGRFPARNRVLAGLGDVVVLAQADAASGSGHTVRAALALGRDVLVVPWPLGHPLYEGGARWVRTHPGRVRALTSFDEAARCARAAYEGRRHVPGGAESPAPASLAERLLAAATRTPLGLAALARAAQATIPEATAALVRLELEGRIERMPGDRYRRRTA